MPRYQIQSAASAVVNCAGFTCPLGLVSERLARVPIALSSTTMSFGPPVASYPSPDNLGHRQPEPWSHKSPLADVASPMWRVYVVRLVSLRRSYSLSMHSKRRRILFCPPTGRI